MWRPGNRTASEQAHYRVHKLGVQTDGSFKQFQITSPRRPLPNRQIIYQWNHKGEMDTSAAGNYILTDRTEIQPLDPEVVAQLEQRSNALNGDRSDEEVGNINTGAESNQSQSAEQSDHIENKSSDDAKNNDDIASGQTQTQNQNQELNLNNQNNNTNTDTNVDTSEFVDLDQIDLDNIDPALKTGNVIHTDNGENNDASNISNTNSNKSNFDRILDEEMQQLNKSTAPPVKRRKLNGPNNEKANKHVHFDLNDNRCEKQHKINVDTVTCIVD